MEINSDFFSSLFIVNQHFLTVLTHYFSTYILVGAIWTVQLVHYPLFKYIEASQFLDFHKKHTQYITYFIGPFMMLELTSLVALYFYEMHSPKNIIKIYMLGIVSLIWVSTIFIFIPLHNKLAKGYDTNTIKKLINVNWARTFLWTLKALILTLSGLI